MTRKNLNQSIRNMFSENTGFVVPADDNLESYTKEETNEIDEQDAIAGVMEPLGVEPAEKKRYSS